MSSSESDIDARARDVEVTDTELIVRLVDGRTLAVPLSWFPRLLHAAPEERQNWELLGEGEGIHWPAVDEDLSVSALLSGAPARPPSEPA